MRKIDKSETLLINEISNLRQNSGEKIYKFGFGQSPFDPPEAVIEALRLNAHRHEYTPVQGISELRNAASTFHSEKLGLSFNPDYILVGPGSKQLLLTAMQAFTQADILIPNPAWVSYTPQAHLLGHTVIKINTSYDAKWHITPDLLDAACQQRSENRQGILILNYPGNPDGGTYTLDELTELANVCRAHNLIVISDEIYGFLTHDGVHHSFAQVYPENTIVTTGLSKWCGAGGWRLGIALLSDQLGPKLLDTMLGIASESYSSASTPIQMAAIEAYQNNSLNNDYLSHQRRILKAAGTHIATELQTAGVNIHTPEGGFYLYPEFSTLTHKYSSSTDLCKAILDATGVALLPGSAFGASPSQLTARLAYVDFNGKNALNASKSIGLNTALPPDFLTQYCPKIVEGTKKLTRWLK